MPTLLIWHGHKFRFFALDRDEPPHVHIEKDGKSPKVWLRNLEVVRNKGYMIGMLRGCLQSQASIATIG